MSNKLKPSRKFHIGSQTILLFAILIILVVVFGVSEDKFLKPINVASMAGQLPEIGILSLAMMVPVMIGGINLSINASANLSAVLSGFFIMKILPTIIPESNPALYLGAMILIALATGLVTGIINGYLVGYVSAPAILATLATMGLFTGLAVGMTKGSSLTGFDQSLGLIASSKVMGIPVSFLIFVGMTAIAYILLNHTTFGFKTRMLGTNAVAANFSGINNKEIIMKDFIFSGIYSSVAGILVMSRTLSASYEYGASTYIMLTLLIYVLAGVVTGEGNVINIFITVLILQVISTGFHMVLVGTRGSSFFKDFIWGLLLILILIINYFSQRSKLKE
jgi:simple sugar transport system permease protein